MNRMALTSTGSASLLLTVEKKIFKTVDDCGISRNNSASRFGGFCFFSVPSEIASKCAPVAQLDRVPGYELGGREFESLRAHHFFKRAL